MSDTTEWRCSACGTLIGIVNGDTIDLRYKAARFVVHGEVTAYCRRCGTENKYTSAVSSPNGDKPE